MWVALCYNCIGLKAIFKKNSVLTMPLECVWFILQTSLGCIRWCVRGSYAFFICMEGFIISTAGSSKEVLINENIRAKEVRLIGPDGEQVGVMPTREALEFAYDHGVDLVLIAPTAEPPVCRAIDYGKYRFEREKREKEARKNQTVVKVKEIQLSCKIDTHDFNTRLNQTIKFLQAGDKVKVSIRFKGREMAHQQIGVQVIERFVEACAEYGTAEKKPVLEGRFVSVMLTPIKPSTKGKS